MDGEDVEWVQDAIRAVPSSQIYIWSLFDELYANLSS
jgi:hypothetical protein